MSATPRSTAPRRSSGSSALVTRFRASTLTSNIHAQSSMDDASTESRPFAPPALFTSACSGPVAARWSRSASTSAWSVRSATNTDAPVSSASARSRSSRRATPTTSHPAARSARTVAAPIPELAPVTTARSTSMRPIAGARPGRRAPSASRGIRGGCVRLNGTMQTRPHATTPARKRRVPLWDNARWIAITLVVIGHGILPLIARGRRRVQRLPVHLLVPRRRLRDGGGYFAKSGPPNARALRQILTDIVFPFFIFETIWTVIRWVLGGAFELDYTTASWTLWFLIALAIWRIVLPYLVLLRFPLLIAIAISIGAGYTETIDATLALSRTLGMLPFFVFGWKLRQWQLTGRWLDLPSRGGVALARAARSRSSPRCSS